MGSYEPGDFEHEDMIVRERLEKMQKYTLVRTLVGLQVNQSVRRFR